MINKQFLDRWPTGRGTGYIGYSHSLRRAFASVGPLVLLDHQFEAVAVKVSNTTCLRDGDVEACSTSGSPTGPLLLPMSSIFYSEHEALTHINSVLQDSIDAKASAVEKLQREMQMLESRKRQLPQESPES